MGLPQGIKLYQGKDNRVYAVGPSGKWYVPSPQDAARQFGSGWEKSVSHTKPAGFDALQESGSFEGVSGSSQQGTGGQAGAGLPSGIRLMQDAGDDKVYAVGPGGKWHIPNPAEASRLFGNDWAKNVERVRPGSFDQTPDFGTFDAAMRAQPQAGQGADPSRVGGNLGFGGAPNSQSGDFGFGQSYQNYLQMAQQTYQNVLSGYQNVLGQQQQRAQGIQQGYGQLQQGVQDTLQGAEQGQRQRIQDFYTGQRGQATQQLTNAGLGNTTVGQSVARGIGADQMKAEQDLSGQFAQMRAGYQSDLGKAGLGFAQQALGADTSLYGHQLDWMDSFRQKEPDPLGYASLAQQGGQFQQSLAQQRQQFQQQNQMNVVPYSQPTPSGGTLTDYRIQRG